MNNWKEFFHGNLIQTGLYKIVHSSPMGDTDTETFSSVDSSNKTSIKTGYLADGELIFCKLVHPDTIGFNKYQEQEHFYRFDYTPGESYGPPGLEYNDMNRKAIYDLLEKGLRGREEQYYHGQRLIKSIVYRNYGVTESSEFGTTIWFEKSSLMNKLRRFFSNKKTDFDKKVIKLESIFKGLDI